MVRVRLRKYLSSYLSSFSHSIFFVISPPFNDHQVNPLMVVVALVLMWTLNPSMLVLVVA